MILVLLFISFFTFADSVDQIQNGKFTDKALCSLCGGRIICGALSESISLDGITDTKTQPVLNFCFAKTSELQSKNREHRPWISKETQRFEKLFTVVHKISTEKSKSKYTNEIVPSLKEKIQTRVNFRLENGFSWKDMKTVLGEKQYKELETENLIFPLLSFESYSQIKGKNKSQYDQYVESLFVADPEDIMVEPNGYAFYYANENNTRNVASNVPLANLTKEDLKKPHDYYNLNDSQSLLEKLKLLPKEFCEKNMYKNVRQASITGLQKLSEEYGGDTSFERAYHFKQLKKEFLNSVDKADCDTKITKLLINYISKLPNPQVLKQLEKIQVPNVERKPSSYNPPSEKKPIYCGFNIDNYQDNCPSK